MFLFFIPISSSKLFRDVRGTVFDIATLIARKKKGERAWSFPLKQCRYKLCCN